MSLKGKTIKIPPKMLIANGIAMWVFLVMGGGFLSDMPVINIVIPISLLFIYFFRTIFRHRSIFRHTLSFIFFCCVYIMMLYFYHISEGVDFKDYANIVVIFLAVFFYMGEFKSRDDFIGLYTTVISFMCIYSLVIFLMNRVFDFTASSTVIGTLYKMWLGQNIRLYTRNAGPFWEAGIWQIYVNFALLFNLLFQSEQTSKRRWIRAIIYCGTILTTLSTTGYIVMAGILLWKMICVMKDVREHRMRIFSLFLIPVIVIIGLTVIVSNPVVSEKFQDDNLSYNRRENDWVVILPIVEESGALGKGMGTHARSALMIKYGIGLNGGGNSVAYSSIVSIHGWLTLLLFMFRVLWSCKKAFSEYWYILYALFLVSWATEPLMFIPLYYFFFIGFQSQTVSEKIPSLKLDKVTA